MLILLTFTEFHRCTSSYLFPSMNYEYLDREFHRSYTRLLFFAFDIFFLHCTHKINLFIFWSDYKLWYSLPRDMVIRPADPDRALVIMIDIQLGHGGVLPGSARGGTARLCSYSGMYFALSLLLYKDWGRGEALPTLSRSPFYILRVDICVVSPRWLPFRGRRGMWWPLRHRLIFCHFTLICFTSLLLKPQETHHSILLLLY
jgi:hypothetical protein